MIQIVLQFMNLLMAQVKEFIRRAKAWRNRVWSKGAGGTGRPKSTSSPCWCCVLMRKLPQ